MLAIPMRDQAAHDDRSTVVLLSSSDNTVDVARQIAVAIDRQWADCPYSKVVLLSTSQAVWSIPGWRRIDAGRSDGWRAELISGLARLEPSVTSIILILDDFLLLSRVDTEVVKQVVAEARDKELGYVRLKPVERSWLISLTRVLRPRRLEKLSASEPYPSSLQIAVWRRDHLVRMLEMPGSIWDFEHQYLSDEPHYAIAGARPIQYRHVVERGRWLGYAKTQFDKVELPFEPGSRPSWGNGYMVRSAVARLRFGLLGYAVVRLKKAVRRR